MLQVHLTRFAVDLITPVNIAVFQYAQRILEIMFVGIVLSCCLTTFLPSFERQNIFERVRGNMRSGNLMGRQLNSIVINMQVRMSTKHLACHESSKAEHRYSAHLQTPLQPSSQTRRPDAWWCSWACACCPA